MKTILDVIIARNIMRCIVLVYHDYAQVTKCYKMKENRVYALMHLFNDPPLISKRYIFDELYSIQNLENIKRFLIEGTNSENKTTC
jgi:hypothetical protein